MTIATCYCLLEGMIHFMHRAPLKFNTHYNLLFCFETSFCVLPEFFQVGLFNSLGWLLQWTPQRSWTDHNCK